MKMIKFGVIYFVVDKFNIVWIVILVVIGLFYSLKI